LQSGFSPSEIVRDPERGYAFSQLDARTGSVGIPFLAPKAKSKDYSERLSIRACWSQDFFAQLWG